MYNSQLCCTIDNLAKLLNIDCDITNMAKIVLNDVSSGYDLSLVNENFDRIETVINDRVLFRDAPFGEPNELITDVDANGKRIFNLPDPVENGEPVTKSYFDSFIGDTPALVAEAQGYAEDAAESAAAALVSEQNAAASAASAEASADQAELFSSLGLAAGSNFNFGLITDSFIAFPTDFGSVP